jgi:hypothetical protein
MTLFDTIEEKKELIGEPGQVLITPAVGKGLFDSAVLLSLELKSFGTSRKLKDSEFDVDASRDKCGANKKLLKSDELKAITRHDAETRQRIALYTLPSQFRSGLYLLPLASIEAVDKILRESIDKRADLVSIFCSKYDTIRWQDSQAADAGGLGGLFKESDYPAVSDVRSAFSMSYSYTEFSAPGKLKSISSELFEREQAKAQSCWKNAIEEGQALLRGAFASLIDHMADRLRPAADGKPKIYRDTLISNVVDFLNTFDSRNLAGDEELARLVKETASMLSGVTPADLRKSETIRARVQAGVESIKTNLAGMVADKPARAITFEDSLDNL